MIRLPLGRLRGVVTGGGGTRKRVLSRNGRLDDGALVGGEPVEVVDGRVDLAIGGLELHLEEPAGDFVNPNRQWTVRPKKEGR